MQYALHIFVNRQWKDDKEELRNKLQIYNILNLPVQVLLFPGGGDLTVKTKTLSDQYADKKGLPHYNYVLQPHLRGFLYIINILRSHRLQSIVDITVAYPDSLPKTELHFIKGYIPHEVCYYVKCYPLASLPTDDEELCQWLRKVWSEKEERLKYFYTHRQFPDEEQQLEKHGSISSLYQAVLFPISVTIITGLLLYYIFYITLAYIAVTVGWLIYRIVREGAIDELLLNEMYKQFTVKSFDYQVPEKLIN